MSILRPRASALALALLVGLPVGAWAQSSAPANANSQPSAAARPVLPAFLKDLAGEWDGVILLKSGEGMSSSVASLSASMQPDGSILMSFDGFVRGEAIDGLVSFMMNDQGRPEMRTVTSALHASSRTSMMGEAQPKVMAFGGLSNPDAGAPVRMEHLVRVVDKDHMILEWVVVAPDGTRSPLMSLDLSRLPQGRRASAGENPPRADQLKAVGVPAMAAATVMEGVD